MVGIQFRAYDHTLPHEQDMVAGGQYHTPPPTPGEAERAEAHGPLLATAREILPPSSRVLVPGAGLGRLGWEIAQMGHTAQSCEFSYFMLLAANFILNDLMHLGAVRIQPYVLQTCNVERNADQFRALRIPDVDPNSLPPTASLSMCAGDFLEVYRGQTSRWDAIVSCFFLDTAKESVSRIHRSQMPDPPCLKCHRHLVWTHSHLRT